MGVESSAARSGGGVGLSLFGQGYVFVYDLSETSLVRVFELVNS